MQHIERKKLVTIIALVAAVVLAGIIVTISLVFSSTSEGNDDNTPQPQVTSTETPSNQDEPVEQGAPIGNASDEEAPPENLYDNDYSNDLGYTALPEGFDPSANTTEGTVYDDDFVYDTFNRVMCELSKKPTSTERALQPLTDLIIDLRKSGTSISINYATEGGTHLQWYQDRLNQRVGSDKQNELSLVYCDAGVVEDEE